MKWLAVLPVTNSPCPYVQVGSSAPAKSCGEGDIDEMIADLKKAKAAVWPKPPKPLCPASVELLGYLRKYGDVTPLKAREELGIEHLPRRIKDLKEHGHPIRTVMKRGHAGKRYAHYSLPKSVSENEMQALTNAAVSACLNANEGNS